MFSDQTDQALRRMAEAAEQFFKAGAAAYGQMANAYAKDIHVLSVISENHEAARLHFEAARKADEARERVERLRGDIDEVARAITYAVPMAERVSTEKDAFRARQLQWTTELGRALRTVEKGENPFGKKDDGKKGEDKE